MQPIGIGQKFKNNETGTICTIALPTVFIQTKADTYAVYIVYKTEYGEFEGIVASFFQSFFKQNNGDTVPRFTPIK